MANLNFPDPAVTQTYTEAGITWTWNATLGVWSSDDNDGFTETDADQRYLRVDADAPDQTRVAGKTTFDETITVNGVIQVNDQANGFNGVSGNDQIALYSKGVQRAVFSDVIRLRTPGRNDVATAVKVNVIDPISPKTDGTAAAVGLNVETGVDQNATQYTGIQHDYTDVGGAVAGEVSAFKSQPNIADVGSVNIGFHSILDSASAGENYHFYGQGDQPSYFGGVTEHAGGVSVNGGSFTTDAAVTSTFNGESNFTNTTTFGTSTDYGQFDTATGSSVSRALKLVRAGSATASVKALEVIANGATQWSVGYDGVAAFSALSGTTAIQMDADDPTAFTSTFALETDEEGNEVQVESTTYTGTTESLLDIIRDLRNRITAIESNEISDDAVDASLLTLIADLTTRVATLEAAQP